MNMSVNDSYLAVSQRWCSQFLSNFDSFCANVDPSLLSPSYGGWQTTSKSISHSCTAANAMLQHSIILTSNVRLNGCHWFWFSHSGSCCLHLRPCFPLCNRFVWSMELHCWLRGRPYFNELMASSRATQPRQSHIDIRRIVFRIDGIFTQCLEIQQNTFTLNPWNGGH